MIAQILTPRLMLVGGGAVSEAPSVLQKLGVHRPLIVSDPYMRDSGMLAHLTDPLDAAGIRWDLFADTVPDPTTDVVEQGLARLRLGTYDCMIAFGGGSPMDTAKAMNVLAALGGKMRDHKVPQAADKAAVPLICVPTTAGTGSEVTKFCVISDTETDEKMLVMGLGCLPTAALVDYRLTMKKPFRLTADTGIDSITHAMEAYVSKKRNPMSDSYALTAMKRLYENIRTACFEPGNEAAREQMMLGATQAGMAFSNASVALVHGMSRPIGAFFHVPHGLSNAMLLPAITQFSAEAALDRYADCARAMGIASAEEGNQSAVNRLVEALRVLNTDLKVPTPKDYGIDAARYTELLPTMARQALASGSPGNNPRVPTEAEIVALYEQVYA
ncbi:MAG: iron-containing alcohol dehydrogenase [Alphaproteobacteria bacterium]|nr:iron-containing alcohol dehydrogenase [Alphaproteobacteria bacterium]MBU0796946.1 iron-containing alcohol dehydrogenase [Alphaproteobacteria bacterium]MBU0888858.1 iron-containing alcohol dehydrogenase [Alphaproteobacteria bacterium]MBU1813878.1 iron-containing alcohol dehydrogenase [Alphaproteobacteria bacterium]MBU2089940.1 iron-containing alcohol dehydrogenase [Alphaproteobacteria bacterium]